MNGFKMGLESVSAGKSAVRVAFDSAVVGRVVLVEGTYKCFGDIMLFCMSCLITFDRD